MLDLPYSAILKGLYMTIALSLLSPISNNLILFSAIMILLIKPKYSWQFYMFFSLFWPAMEIVLIHFSSGNAWTYKHPDIINIPAYLLPLWAIVSECVLDIFQWGIRMNVWSVYH